MGVTVTGLTAGRMLEIEAASVVDGSVVGNDLILEKKDGSIINAGNVRGPQGPTGAFGSPPTVTALPSSPANGDEVYFQDAAMAALGIKWRLAYRAGATGLYKWEFLGGSSVEDRVDAIEGRANAVFGDLATVGPTITVPLAGDYRFEIAAFLQSAVAGTFEIYAALSVNGSVPANQSGLTFASTAIFAGVSSATKRRLNALAAGSVVRLRYASQSGLSSGFGSRVIVATPIRVG